MAWLSRMVAAVFAVFVVALVWGCEAGPPQAMGSSDSRVIAASHSWNQFGLRLDGAEEYWVPQESEETCWAASIQMVKSWRGDEAMEQWEYVDRLNRLNDALQSAFEGSDVSIERQEAASRSQVRSTMFPVDYADPFPLYVVLGIGDGITYSAQSMLEELARGEMVVAGLEESRLTDMGHMYVVTGADYRKVRYGKGGLLKFLNDVLGTYTYELDRVYLMDPDGGREGRPKFLTMYGPEFEDRVDFAGSRRSILEAERDRVQYLAGVNRGPGLYVVNPFDDDPLFFFGVDLTEGEFDAGQ